MTVDPHALHRDVQEDLAEAAYSDIILNVPKDQIERFARMIRWGLATERGMRYMGLIEPYVKGAVDP